MCIRDRLIGVVIKIHLVAPHAGVLRGGHAVDHAAVAGDDIHPVSYTHLAKELGIPFYDKELLQEAAKKSGLCEKIFENFDERPKSLLYSIAMDSYMFALPGTGAGDSLEQQVYLATFDTIRHLAAQGPCVIIGRCADYAQMCIRDRRQCGR